MALSKVLEYPRLSSFVVSSILAGTCVCIYKVFKYITKPKSNPVSPVHVTLAGDQEMIGLTLESQELTQDYHRHILKVTDPYLEKKFRELELDQCTELQEVCEVKAAVLSHRDLLEYILRLNVNEIDLQLYFTKTNDFGEPEDHTKVVTFKLTRPCNKLELDLETRVAVIHKPIDIVPYERKDYIEGKFVIRWVKGSMYVFVEEDGSLSVGPLSEKVVPKAVFVRRQYSGFTRDIPQNRRVFPNGESVIVHLFHRDARSVNYVTNTKDKVIMTNRGQPIQGKVLDERDPRFYYFERIPGTSYCVFICSCFSGKKFLSYNEATKSLCLKEIANPSTLVSHHDDVKFELIAPDDFNRMETTV